MQDNITISLAVPAYNERLRGNFQWIWECVRPASLSPLVREIAIVNDGPTDYHDLGKTLADVPKVHLFQNAERLHVFANKVEAVYRSTSDWVLLFDSDNFMRQDYFESLESLQPWKPDTWYCASWARPEFDYRAFIGDWGVADFPGLARRKTFWCFANTGNQFIHRQTFMDIFERYRGKRFDLEQPDYFGVGDRSDEKWFLAYGAQDSFFLMKEWLLAGNRVRCVDGLEYGHRIKTGQLSNYNRGPAEKEILAPVYFLELCDQTRNEKHQYKYLRLDNPLVEFSREDSKRVTVNMNTGQVAVR